VSDTATRSTCQEAAMPTTYIAGYDGSDASRAAVRFTEALAARTGARVVAAAVYPRIPYVPAPGAPPIADAELDAEARGEAERRLAELEGENLDRRALPSSSPSRGLHRLAETEDASLVAVGMTHRHGLGRIIPGGIADRLLHGSPCPVAAVPPAWSAAELATVGVAYDGTEEARAALDVAAGLAGRLGARIVLLAAVDRIDVVAYPMATPPIDNVVREELDRELRSAAKRLPASLDAEARLLDGAPGPAIADACKADVDVLVTGSRGYGPARSVLVGAVSRFLVDHAPCPVVVVPRGAAAPLEPAEGTAESRPAASV
jgi:nucleotide-binding universal stress UspA family protein